MQAVEWAKKFLDDMSNVKIIPDCDAIDYDTEKNTQLQRAMMIAATQLVMGIQNDVLERAAEICEHKKPVGEYRQDAATSIRALQHKGL